MERKDIEIPSLFVGEFDNNVVFALLFKCEFCFKHIFHIFFIISMV